MFQKFRLCILKVRNEVFTEPRTKAEVLNSQFSSVLNNKETENIPVVDPGENPIPTIGTITSWLEKQLSGLKADKAYGPDGIPPGFKRRMPRKYQRFLLISIKTVSIPELCPANGNMPTYVPFIRKERNEARITYLHRFKSTRAHCAEPCYEIPVTIWSAHWVPTWL